MPRGENLDHETRSAGGVARWKKATITSRADHLRAVAAGMLRRAEELELSAEQNLGEEDTAPLSEVAE